MKHLVFRISIDPEKLTAPICGATSSETFDGGELTTHYGFADCQDCTRLIHRTLFEVLGPNPTLVRETRTR